MKIDRHLLIEAQRAADSQSGIITSAQADNYGVSHNVRHRLVAEGSWRRIARGIYAVTADSWQQRAWAGVLIGGPGAVLGHEAAIRLAGIGKQTANSRLGADLDRITVFVRPQTSVPHDDRWRFIRSSRQGQGTPPCTSVTESIIDVGAAWCDEDLLSLIGSAVTGGLTTIDGLRAGLADRKRHRQRFLLNAIIDDVAAGTTTVLEQRYRHQVESAHGLPVPKRQVSPVGRYRVDNWYEQYRLIVEVDGRATHLGVAAVVDLERDNIHMAHGISTLRFTWPHVTRTPCQTARIVAQALTRGGWSGHPHSCPACSTNPRLPPARTSAP